MFLGCRDDKKAKEVVLKRQQKFPVADAGLFSVSAVLLLPRRCVPSNSLGVIAKLTTRGLVVARTGVKTV
jgi:hypothetical protein